MKKNQGLQVSFDEDLKLKKELQTFKSKYHQEEFNISFDDLKKENDFFKKGEK
tara:strand:+ start:804 stop:962 length:159 start_codon:yes stop_codon:yes gene_type:complete